jgi:osmoprotectant transport system substrate-binding protein
MSAVNNTYGIRDEQGRAQKRGIVTMSDLAKAIKGAPSSRSRRTPSSMRARWPAGWQSAYGFEFDRDNVKRMDTGLTYSALKDRQVDVPVVFATDGAFLHSTSWC